MTRKRVQEDLVSAISEHCLYCSGTGSTRSRITVVYDVLREIQREALRARGRDTVFVNAHPTVADLMYSSEMDSVEDLEKVLEKKVVVRAMGHYHLERYEVYSQ